MNPFHLAHCLAYRTHSWSSGFQKAFLSLLIPACKTCIIGLGGLHTTTVAVLGRHPMVLASLSTGVFTKTEVAHSSMSPLGLVSGNPILPYSGSLQIFSMTHSVFHNWCPVEDTCTLPNLTVCSRSALPALGHSLCCEMIVPNEAVNLFHPNHVN